MLTEKEIMKLHKEGAIDSLKKALLYSVKYTFYKTFRKKEMANFCENMALDYCDRTLWYLERYDRLKKKEQSAD